MGSSPTTWFCTDAPVRGSWVMRGGSESSRRPRPARLLNSRSMVQMRSPRVIQPSRSTFSPVAVAYIAASCSGVIALETKLPPPTEAREAVSSCSSFSIAALPSMTKGSSFLSGGANHSRARVKARSWQGARVGGGGPRPPPLSPRGGAAGGGGGESLFLGPHERLGVPVVSRKPVAGLGQEVAELALPEGHHLQAADDRVRVAEPQLRAHLRQVLLRDVAALGQLHRNRDGAAGGDRIHGVEVAHVVGVGHGIQIADAAVGAEAEQRLVLRALAAARPLGRLLDLADARAAGGAGGAALVAAEHGVHHRHTVDG